jgi:hypothetical protein
MRHHRLSVVPTSTACATALRAQAPPAVRPALVLLTRLVVFPEDARLVGVILGDVVVLFDSIHRDDAGDVQGTASRPRFLGHYPSAVRGTAVGVQLESLW